MRIAGEGVFGRKELTVTLPEGASVNLAASTPPGLPDPPRFHIRSPRTGELIRVIDLPN